MLPLLYKYVGFEGFTKRFCQHTYYTEQNFGIKISFGLKRFLLYPTIDNQFTYHFDDRSDRFQIVLALI